MSSLARVWFGFRGVPSVTERWVLLARIFLWSVIPFACGVFLLTPAWWFSLLGLALVCVAQYFIEFREVR